MEHHLVGDIHLALTKQGELMRLVKPVVGWEVEKFQLQQPQIQLFAFPFGILLLGILFLDRQDDSFFHQGPIPAAGKLVFVRIDVTDRMARPVAGSVLIQQLTIPAVRDVRRDMGIRNDDAHDGAVTAYSVDFAQHKIRIRGILKAVGSHDEVDGSSLERKRGIEIMNEIDAIIGQLVDPVASWMLDRPAAQVYFHITSSFA